MADEVTLEGVTTVAEVVDGLLEVAAELSAGAGVTIEQWIEYSAHAYARMQGQQITDCQIELVLEERPPAN
jgi:hypothetical protein